MQRWQVWGVDWITLEGNCLVSEASFDYLHGKYGDELGIIWFGAQLDIYDVMSIGTTISQQDFTRT